MGSRLTKDVLALTGFVRSFDDEDEAVVVALLVVIAQELRQLREHMTEPWQLTDTPETPDVVNCVAAEPDQTGPQPAAAADWPIELRIYREQYGREAKSGYVVARDSRWVGGRYATPEDAATAGITWGESPRPLP